MSSRVPGSSPGRPMWARPGIARRSALSNIRVTFFFGSSPIVFGNPTKNVLKVVQCLIVEDNPHASRSRKRVRACASDVFRIFLRTAAPHFGKLLFGKPERTVVLLFHELDHVGNVGLPFGRPSEYAIDNFLHLIFSHLNAPNDSGFRSSRILHKALSS